MEREASFPSLDSDEHLNNLRFSASFYLAEITNPQVVYGTRREYVRSLSSLLNNARFKFRLLAEHPEEAYLVEDLNLRLADAEIVDIACVDETESVYLEYVVGQQQKHSLPIEMLPSVYAIEVTDSARSARDAVQL